VTTLDHLMYKGGFKGVIMETDRVSVRIERFQSEKTGLSYDVSSQKTYGSIPLMFRTRAFGAHVEWLPEWIVPILSTLSFHVAFCQPAKLKNLLFSTLCLCCQLFGVARKALYNKCHPPLLFDRLSTHEVGKNTATLFMN
jgi:hypothetical protein